MDFCWIVQIVNRFAIICDKILSWSLCLKGRSGREYNPVRPEMICLKTYLRLKEGCRPLHQFMRVNKYPVLHHSCKMKAEKQILLCLNIFYGSESCPKGLLSGNKNLCISKIMDFDWKMLFLSLIEIHFFIYTVICHMSRKVRMMLRWNW